MGVGVHLGVISHGQRIFCGNLEIRMDFFTFRRGTVVGSTLVCVQTLDRASRDLVEIAPTKRNAPNACMQLKLTTRGGPEWSKRGKQKKRICKYTLFFQSLSSSHERHLSFQHISACPISISLSLPCSLARSLLSTLYFELSKNSEAK